MVAVASMSFAYKFRLVSVFYRDSSAGCTVSFLTLLTIASPLDPQAFTTKFAKFPTADPCGVTYVKIAA